VNFVTLSHFANIPVPQNPTEMILYSESTDGSQFSGEKKRVENLFLGSSDNKKK